MVTHPFEPVILRLWELGFFQFILPFMVTSAIFYGLLRKTQLFGPPEKNVAVNGVVAMAMAFWVWAAPIIAGIDIWTEMVVFFTQTLIAMLGFIVGLSIVGMFAPANLPEHLSKVFGGGGFWIVILIVGFLTAGIILGTSGLMRVFFPTGVPIPEIPEELLAAVVVIAMMGITMLVIILPSK
jgi:hypothetical protein